MSKRLAGGRYNDHKLMTNRARCFCAHPNYLTSIHIAGHLLGLPITEGGNSSGNTSISLDALVCRVHVRFQDTTRVRQVASVSPQRAWKERCQMFSAVEDCGGSWQLLLAWLTQNDIRCIWPIAQDTLVGNWKCTVYRVGHSGIQCIPCTLHSDTAGVSLVRLTTSLCMPSVSPD